MIQKANYKQILLEFFYLVQKYPISSFIFLLGILLSGSVQLIGFGLIYPATMMALNHSQSKEQNPVINKIESIFTLFDIQFNLTNVILGIVISVILSSVFLLLAQYYQHNFLRKLDIKLRRDFFQKVLNSSWGALSKLNHGEFVSIGAREIENYKILIKYDFMILANLINLIFFLLFSLLVDWRVISVTVGLVALNSFVFFPFYKIIMALGQKNVKEFSLYNSNLIEIAKAFKYIKTSSNENKILSYLDRYIVSLPKFYFKSMILSDFTARFSEVLIVITFAFIIYLSVVVFHTPLENLTVIFAILIRTLPEVKLLTDNINRAVHSSVSRIAIDSMLNTISASEYGAKPASPTFLEKNEIKNILLDNVGFGYSSENLLLKNFSFEFEKGKFYAITGQTGAGKSTLLDLISGILKPLSGKVKINQVPLESYDIKEIHKRLGYLTQENLILNGSIYENLIWGIDRDVSERELDEALVLSQTKEFISTRNIHEELFQSGANLSGGQKQRISIARVLLGKFDFILMDEPTSALDASTEQQFMENLAKLKGQIGLIYVTHRKETLKYADSIIEF
ncbi:ATP-binding cassette domain-containing protein [Leptospira kirschneri]|uniref:ATP-binding cassette domain-containing protein n=1 Tax=Leptospira kirschneri TaxID=29507 RepID=UPI000292A1A5|nr:ATP-binding cassette domain-containing protein [Leptospira kirschneri]EKO59925.1 ABC transporter, ATP-binding protein [Leptospira kirschneri str. H2]